MRKTITTAEKERLALLVRAIMQGRVWTSVNDPWYCECFGIIQGLNALGLWNLEAARAWLDGICADYRPRTAEALSKDINACLCLPGYTCSCGAGRA